MNVDGIGGATRRVLVVLACMVGLACAGVAMAGGGDSIANAPELPLGQQQTVSTEHADIWRVTLAGNDLLVLDY